MILILVQLHIAMKQHYMEGTDMPYLRGMVGSATVLTILSVFEFYRCGLFVRRLTSILHVDICLLGGTFTQYGIT